MLIASRLSVLIVAVIAVLLSLTPNDSILNLVGNAWAGFGSAFGPLIVFSLFWKKTTWQGALAGMLTGGIVVLAWVYIQHDYKDWYEMIPGFLSSTAMIYIVSLLTQQPNQEIDQDFDEMKAILDKELKNAS